MASTVKSIFGLGREMRGSFERLRLLSFSRLVLRGIALLDFAVQRVAAEEGIELLLLHLLGLQLLVAGGLVSRRRLALLARFRAFDGYDFAGHKITPSPSPVSLPLRRPPRPRGRRRFRANQAVRVACGGRHH